MKNKISIVLISCMLLMNSCVTDDYNNVPDDPDRGHIENVDKPIRPPSLTNEWDDMVSQELPVSTNIRFVLDYDDGFIDDLQVNYSCLKAEASKLLKQ